MANITLRSTKGSPLTNTEIDTNFSALDTRNRGILNKSISANVTLTSDEADNFFLNISGTGNVTISVPNSFSKQWQIYNGTSGGLVIYVKTVSGAITIPCYNGIWTTFRSNGTEVSSGFGADVLYCDTQSNGTNNRTVATTQFTTTAVTNGTSGKVNRSGDTFTGNVGVTGNLSVTGTLSMSSAFSFRNKLINGDFDFWQRTSGGQTLNGYGSDDRWLNGHVGSSKSHTRVAFSSGQTDVPNNPTHHSRTTVTSVAGAGNYVTKIQRIEDVSKSSGKTMVYSFWAKADSAKNIAVSFFQDFGTGGSPSTTVSAISPTTFSLTTSWQKFTGIVSFPSISGKTLGTNNNHSYQMAFWFDVGSNWNSQTNSLGQQSGVFDIAQVQLEEGSVATPFEQRPYGLELHLCHRYYISTNTNLAVGSLGYAPAGYNVGGVFSFPTPMRTTPIIGTTPANTNIVSPIVDSVNPFGFRYYGTTAGDGGYQISFAYNADAEL